MFYFIEVFLFVGVEAVGIEDQVVAETVSPLAKGLLTKAKITVLPKLNKNYFLVLLTYIKKHTQAFYSLYKYRNYHIVLIVHL